MSDGDRLKVLRQHRKKVEAGDDVHLRIQSSMDQVREKNNRGGSMKKANGWDDQADDQKRLQEVKNRPTNISEKTISFIADYNTVESVLLGCGILVNLAGIMFLSGRFQGELRQTNKEEYEVLGVLVLILIIFSMIYFFLVLLYETLGAFKPQLALKIFSMCSCGKTTTQQTTSSTKNVLDFEEDSKEGQMLVTNTNPMAAALSSEGSSSVANSLGMLKEPPTKEQWPALRAHIASLSESLENYREQLKVLREKHHRSLISSRSWRAGESNPLTKSFVPRQRSKKTLSNTKIDSIGTPDSQG